MHGAGSGSYAVVGFGFSSAELLCSATREFINKTDLIFIDYEEGRWMELAEDCVQWWASVLSVLNLCVLIPES